MKKSVLVALWLCPELSVFPDMDMQERWVIAPALPEDGCFVNRYLDGIYVLLYRLQRITSLTLWVAKIADGTVPIRSGLYLQVHNSAVRKRTRSLISSLQPTGNLRILISRLGDLRGSN